MPDQTKNNRHYYWCECHQQTWQGPTQGKKIQSLNLIICAWLFFLSLQKILTLPSKKEEQVVLRRYELAIKQWSPLEMNSINEVAIYMAVQLANNLSKYSNSCVVQPAFWVHVIHGV